MRALIKQKQPSCVRTIAYIQEGCMFAVGKIPKTAKFFQTCPKIGFRRYIQLFMVYDNLSLIIDESKSNVHKAKINPRK